MKKHILNTRKQTRIRLPKNNLWFFSEDSETKPMHDSENKSAMKDRSNNLNKDFIFYSTGNSEKNKKDKECYFVVDWQMSDVY
jgi:hypothetical protein